uniref:Uncharacterized protein n=1 Tax=Triticum urartu TaxID=4572 RepID=A0A8R7TFA5_TRIUA
LPRHSLSLAQIRHDHHRRCQELHRPCGHIASRGLGGCPGALSSFAASATRAGLTSVPRQRQVQALLPPVVTAVFIELLHSGLPGFTDSPARTTASVP